MVGFVLFYCGGDPKEVPILRHADAPLEWACLFQGSCTKPWTHSHLLLTCLSVHSSPISSQHFLRAGLEEMRVNRRQHFLLPFSPKRCFAFSLEIKRKIPDMQAVAQGVSDGLDASRARTSAMRTRRTCRSHELTTNS